MSGSQTDPNVVAMPPPQQAPQQAVDAGGTAPAPTSPQAPPAPPPPNTQAGGPQAVQAPPMPAPLPAAAPQGPQVATNAKDAKNDEMTPEELHQAAQDYQAQHAQPQGDQTQQQGQAAPAPPMAEGKPQGQAVPAGTVAQSDTTGGAPSRAPALVDPRPYASVSNDPVKSGMLQTVGSSTGTSPVTIASYWNAESGGRLYNIPRGQEPSVGITKGGGIGPMQIIPSTAADPRVNDNGRLDVNNPRDNLEMGARLIRINEAKWGPGTLASAFVYNRGDGRMQSLINNPESAHTDAMTHTGIIYALKVRGINNPSQDQFNSAVAEMTHTTPSNITGDGIIKAATQAGPSGVLNYISQSKGNQMGLSSAWQAAETAMQNMIIDRHGSPADLEAASNFIMQQAHQGSNQFLMQAQQALANGDSVGAAKSLAAAHAFFPDGSAGQFGVDAQGNVWGQRLDENNKNAPMGQHFQVTQQGLMAMMNQTSDPNQFANMMMKEQAAVSAANHSAVYDESLHDKLPNQQLLQQQKDAAAQSRADTRADAQVDAARIRSEKVKDTTTAASAKEVGTLYDRETNPNTSDSDRARMSDIHTDARHMGANPVTAEVIARGMSSGKLKAVVGQDGNATVVDDKGRPVGLISGQLAKRLQQKVDKPDSAGGGQVGKPGQGGNTATQVGSAANSGYAVGSGMSQNLAGTQTAAVDTGQQAQPQGGAPTSPQPQQAVVT